MESIQIYFLKSIFEKLHADQQAVYLLLVSLEIYYWFVVYQLQTCSFKQALYIHFFSCLIKDGPVWKNFISSWQLIISEFWLMDDELWKIIPDVLWIEINKSCNKNLANVCCGFCGWQRTAHSYCNCFVLCDKKGDFSFFRKLMDFRCVQRKCCKKC